MAKDYRATYRKAAKAYLADTGGELVPEGAGDPGPSQWSDVWLLQAIKTAQGGKPATTLEDIYGAGDAINHAIFTDAELMGGFARLAGAGYIAAHGATCALTAKFLDAWQAVGGGRRRSLSKQQEGLQKILEAPSWDQSAG